MKKKRIIEMWLNNITCFFFSKIRRNNGGKYSSYSIVKVLFISVISIISVSNVNANQNDSLSVYLQQAIYSNSNVLAQFADYKSVMEQIPQVGAYKDPELSIGWFINPMQTMMGKQHLSLTLMQMIPWFGTLKAAKEETRNMAMMKFEKFRGSCYDVIFGVKEKWYMLSYLKKQEQIIREEIDLLERREKLSLNKLTAANAVGGESMGKTSSDRSMSSHGSSSGSISSMGEMQMKGADMSMTRNTSPTQSSSKKSMPSMSGSMNSSMGGSISEVIEIKMKQLEIENKLEEILSQYKTTEAEFNTILNRPISMEVYVVDTIFEESYLFSDSLIWSDIMENNPMLRMMHAERAANESMGRMQHKMSLPMIGIGLEYVVVSPSKHGAHLMPEMNGKDMIMPMVSVSLPIFRGKYRAQQREIRFKQEAIDNTEDEITQELQLQFFKLKEEKNQIFREMVLVDKKMEFVQNMYKVALGNFSAGRMALSDLLSLEQKILDLKLDKEEAALRYNILMASLEKLIASPQSFKINENE